ncbi:MAG: MotA/TolQ/ExbB proton channel family protein [Deltaproteobacteria bacterium]|nr:MotA/TolQ/ExbB proton channel family protein [Deltaproteobacteria bacterium]
MNKRTNSITPGSAIKAAVFKATALLLPAVFLLSATPAAAQEGAAKAANGALNYSLMDLVQFGGIVGYVILLLSVVAVALIVEYTLSIRRKTLMPEEERLDLRKMIDEGRFDELRAKTGSGESSFFGRVVSAGVKEHDRGYEAVVKAMEDSADENAGRLLRKIEHLNMIANIAPMLGLLGTVMGMVNSFNQISVAVGGVDPRRLAGGIFEALMTTVMGLIVAIPSLYAFGMFRNRVDALSAEVVAEAEDAVSPLRNGIGGK